MKNIVYYIIGISLCLGGFSACDSFFDDTPQQTIDSKDAYNTVQDVQNGLNGAYYAFAYYGLYGNYAIAIGDFAADQAVADQNAGHFVEINQYIMNETSTYLDQLWLDGYRVLDRTTRTINGGLALIEKGGLEDDEVGEVYSVIAQCYGLRAMASHALAGIFGLPYGTDNNPHGGIIIIKDQPVTETDKVSRSSVEQTYAYILEDIKSARSYFAKTTIALNSFYVNEAGLYAFEARVALHMKNWTLAAQSAQSAIDTRNSGDVTDETYVKMWNSLAITDEDIFTLAKTKEDNLSADALNTLYGSYGGLVTDTLVKQFKSTDIRLKLINSSNRPLKFAGLPEAAAVSNIPIFRKSEMYLVIAEAKAQLSAIADAQKALFYTAKRDKSITAETQLPADQAQLLEFIARERQRELFQEGFRWYDARRTGELIAVSDGLYLDYDVSKFVYPVPANEINAGAGTQQNTDWANYLPE